MFVKKIKVRNSELNIVVISVQDDVSTVTSLLKYEAYDYLIKDNDAKGLAVEYF